MLQLFLNVLFVVGNSDYRKTIVTNKNKSIDLNILIKQIFFDKSYYVMKIMVNSFL